MTKLLTLACEIVHLLVYSKVHKGQLRTEHDQHQQPDKRDHLC